MAKESEVKYTPRRGEVLRSQVQAVYAYMEKDSVLDEHMARRYWVGSVTHVLPALGIALSNYSRIMNTLKQLGCIEFRYRGGGNSPSEIWLLARPTDGMYEEARRTGELGKGRAAAVAKLNKSVSKDLTNINESLKTIAGLLQELDQRITTLETLNEESEDTY